MAKKLAIARPKTDVAAPVGVLLAEIRQIIVRAREQTYQAVDAALVLTNWHVGDRIRREVLKEKRAAYGKKIVSALGRQLEKEFGRGYAEKSLRRMVQFAEVFPDRQIVAALIRQLSWTHFIALIPLKDRLQREFYAEMCRVERWGVRTLWERIQSMLYERTQSEVDASAISGSRGRASARRLPLWTASGRWRPCGRRF